MDPYQNLAQRLDQIPNRFPKTRSGVELKLLAKLFTPQEAALASSLSPEWLSAGDIASKNGLSEPEVKSMLIGMFRNNEQQQ